MWTDLATSSLRKIVHTRWNGFEITLFLSFPLSIIDVLSHSMAHCHRPNHQSRFGSTWVFYKRKIISTWWNYPNSNREKIGICQYHFRFSFVSFFTYGWAVKEAARQKVTVNNNVYSWQLTSLISYSVRKKIAYSNTYSQVPNNWTRTIRFYFTKNHPVRGLLGTVQLFPFRFFPAWSIIKHCSINFFL